MPLDFTGQHIRLRPLQERDLAPLADAYLDLDLQLTTDGDAPPMSDVQVKAFWNDIITDPGADLRYFAIEALPEHPQAGQMIGACSLQHIDLRNRHAELSIFMIARDLQGLGYGTDAVCLLCKYGFGVLRLDKIYLGVYEFNESGLRVYEKVGFHYEGRHRQMLHYDGRYWDEWHMGILRVEWDIYTKPPADGLHPYHPADLDAALALIQRHHPGDKNAARDLLRRWWRQTDDMLYSYQVDSKLVGLLLRDETGETRHMLIDDAHRDALQKFLK